MLEDTEDKSQVMDLTSHAELNEKNQAQISTQALKRAQKFVGKSQKYTHPSNVETPHLSWLMNKIKAIITTSSPSMKMHKVKDENSDEAAEHNAKRLKHYKWDSPHALAKQ